jgi:4-alpha-glucanotransferase
MLVVQFAFEPDEPTSPHRFENHTAHRIVYAGTHDTNTVRGWLDWIDPPRRSLLDAELARRGIRDRQPWWSVIRLAYSSVAGVAMVQAQDVLGLGSEARMNQPARASGNWRWRLERGQLTRALARRLRGVTEEAGRLPA